MKISWVKTHWLIKKIFPNYVWNIPNQDKKVYLTFDDGPTPEITEWTLQQLKNYQAKATFFCIGDNIRKFPEVFKKVSEQGHALGNHTYHHLNGWKTDTEKYIENVLLHGKEHASQTNEVCTLFRPPYGKIKRSQSKLLRQSGYKIVMWDVLSEDFDCSITKEKCLENVVNNVQSGSIVVFHDSVKAFPHLEYVLPRVLQFLKEKGFVCDRLDYTCS